MHKGDWKEGASIPYSTARVEAWATEKLKEATTAWMAGDMAPHVAFLPGYKDQDGGDVEGQVRVCVCVAWGCVPHPAPLLRSSCNHGASAREERPARAFHARARALKQGTWGRCSTRTGSLPRASGD